MYFVLGKVFCVFDTHLFFSRIFGGVLFLFVGAKFTSYRAKYQKISFRILFLTYSNILHINFLKNGPDCFTLLYMLSDKCSTLSFWRTEHFSESRWRIFSVRARTHLEDWDNLKSLNWLLKDSGKGINIPFFLVNITVISPHDKLG